MAVITYKYNEVVQISPHFKSSEFKCKCGKKHDILIDTELVELLEKLRSSFDAKSLNIYSGYRCNTQDIKVGGSGIGSHTKGKAADFYIVGKDGKHIEGKKVCLKLEDMGHNKGIGYRCGGSLNVSGNTHVDVSNRKWYGDESKKEYRTKSCCQSYYDYFKIPKDIKKQYQLLYDKWLRKQPKVAVNKIIKINKDTVLNSIDNKIYIDTKKNKWIYVSINNKIGYTCIEDSSGIQAKEL